LLINRFQQQLPVIEVCISQSSVVVRCHDYKEAVEKQVRWLTEIEEKVREDVPLDNLDSMRVLLEELEASCLQIPHRQQFILRYYYYYYFKISLVPLVVKILMVKTFIIIIIIIITFKFYY